MRWAGRLQQKLRAVLGGVGHQHTAAADDLALGAGPGTDAGVERAAFEIGVTFLGAHTLDHAFNPHHPFQLDPVELQGRIGVACQLLALATVVVGVPDDAAFIEPFDQHDAGARPQVAAHGGQGHGIGFGQLACNGFTQPLLKLLQGLGVGGVLVQLGTFVTFAQLGDVVGQGGHGGFE